MNPKVKIEAEEEAGIETSIPGPASPPAPAATPALPSRMFIITVHPNGTNPLSVILDLYNQPSTMAIDNLFSGAFKACFESSRTASRGCLIANSQQAMRSSIDAADYAWAHAFHQGKALCANICAPWLIDPTVLNIYPAPAHAVVQGDTSMFKARVPASYASALGGLFNYTNMNLSMFPDEYLRTWGMTFVIIHPIILFPLIYHALTSSLLPDIQHSCALHMTYHWAVTLYKWAQADAAAPTPIIIEADALMDIPEHLFSRFCKQTRLQLDPDLVRYQDARAYRETRLWNYKEYRDRFVRLIAEGRSTLDAIIELAKRVWVASFGALAAGVIEDCIRAAEGDFMYLYDRRLQ
ncbi:hypothetical protein BJY00DRAFT_314253 [Aspergillus carlsbadensis]|nr:hypothetical protein BJY00DRAFT_314253 [Aspergillus carlsbadensis]